MTLRIPARSTGTAVLASAFVLLGGLLLFVDRMEIDLTPLPVNHGNEGGSSKPAAAKANSSPIDTQNFSSTFDRPVFSATRRPFVAPAPPSQTPVLPVAPPVAKPVAEVAPPRPPAIKFQGTRSFGGSFSALVIRENGETAWLDVGQDVAGWKVNSVTASSLTISSNGRSHSMSLFDTKEFGGKVETR